MNTLKIIALWELQLVMKILKQFLCRYCRVTQEIKTHRKTRNLQMIDSSV